MCLCIFDDAIVTSLEVAISVDIGQVRKPEVIDHYPFTGATVLRRRVRELGIRIGKMECGNRNSVADVAGVSVGQVGLVSGEGRLVLGKGPVRTGVTVILPHEGNVYKKKLRAGVHVQNGAGELTGALNSWNGASSGALSHSPTP